VGTAIAPGTYTLTVSYHDALGNPAATSASVSGVTVVAPSTPAPVTVTSTTAPARPRQRPLGPQARPARLPARPLHSARIHLHDDHPRDGRAAFTGRRGRRELTLTLQLTASGPQTIELTSAQWRRLRRGRTKVVASAGSSTSSFAFKVR
jgi:hypothetical protein